MVDLQSQYYKIKNDVDNAVLNVMDSAAFINGPEVKSFQNEMETYLDVKHVIPCANGTDALQIALMGLDLQEGDEVITADFTFAAGGVACLIQAFPGMNRDLMRTNLRQNASLFPAHNDQMGYGILNFGSFYNSTLNTSELVKKNTIAIFPNPVKNILNIATEAQIISTEVYDNLGRMILKSAQKSIKVEDFAKGTYYLKIQTKDKIYYEKFLKQ